MNDFGGTFGAGRFSRARGRVQGGQGAGINYPSPFFDIAHTYLPTTVKQMFRWCRYYFFVHPLINAVVFKMSQYPITDLVYFNKDPQLKTMWKDFLEKHLMYRSFQEEVGLDYYCFHGDVKAITKDGVFRLRDLVGKTAQVLSKDGVYRPATFVESTSKQELLEVEFRDGRTVLATPDHQWWVSTSSGGTTKVTTTELKGRSIPRNVAPRPEKNDDYYEGVRHGFVFGDGTLYNDGKQARACFFGTKDQEMLKYFEGHGSPPYKESGGNIFIHGMPPHYKQLPENSSSASYWYGFLCGFLAADGSVDVAGCTVLTQRNKAALEAISDQLPRIGMIAGPVRGYYEVTEYGEGTTYILSLFKQYMQPEDLLLPHHRARFEDNFKPTTYGTHVTVVDVRKTGLFEKVYCAMEPETKTFTINDGVLTGNTYGNALVSIFFPFKKMLECKNCKFSAPAKTTNYYFRNYQFYWQCPRCQQHGEAKVHDNYLRSARGIRLLRWNPEDIDIRYNDLNGEYTFYYEMPVQLKNDIIMGKKNVVEEVPQIFIEALQKRKAVVLSRDNVYHFKRPTLAGKDRGWGIPLLLPVLKDAFYLQVLKKAQESIALEHIVPLRILFPQAGSATSDPYTSVNLGDWKDQIGDELNRWRFDNNYIPILPLPVGQQTIGGDGRALLLGQEIRVWSEQIVTGMGVPQELVFGGLSYSGSNVSLRMLENFFLGYMVNHLRLLKWVIGRVSSYMNWNPIDAKFKPFKMADDLQRKAYNLQLNQAGKISDGTLLADADFDAEKEDEAISSESARRAESMKKSRLSQAEIEGEAQLVMSRYQLKTQKEQMDMQASMQPAPGEPGAEAEGVQEGGMPQPVGEAQAAQQQAQQPQPQQAAPQMPPQLPPAMAPTQSPLTLGAQQQGPSSPEEAGSMNIDLLAAAQQIANYLVGLDENSRQMALANLQQRSPELYETVLGMLNSMQGGQGETAGRPLPEQRPPMRSPGAALI